MCGGEARCVVLVVEGRGELLFLVVESFKADSMV